MPELPEVEALAGFLRERLVGRVVARVDVAGIAALKTYDPPVTSLGGLAVTDVRRARQVPRHRRRRPAPGGSPRQGRLGAVEARSCPTTVLRPGKGPIVLRVHLDDGSGLDFTEAGTTKKLAVYVVHDASEVPGVARLGPDPLTLDRAALEPLLDEHARTQLKGLLRSQSVIAGIGNAYSDEILHVAGLSPFALAGRLDEDGRTRLFRRDRVDAA